MQKIIVFQHLMHALFSPEYFDTDLGYVTYIISDERDLSWKVPLCA
jgi:hypothetical protein